MLLDDPVQAALTSRHAALAIEHGAARRYPYAIAAYAAGPFDDLAAITEPGDQVRLFSRDPLVVPAGWSVQLRKPMEQMVALRAVAGAHDAEPLGPADVPEMLALAAVAEPGPFFARTIELGRYVGIRRDGRLVAMAGERLKLDGFTEISGVCAHPEHRGRGYGRSLVAALVAAALAEGQVPFLHVTPDNRARALYERLGFTTRTTMHLTAIRRPASR
jgi:ribosomal protein S18 acetylase RimI-like enzyme